MSDSKGDSFSADSGAAGVSGIELWTRDGFNGEVCAMVRPNYSPNFLSAVGTHVPRSFNLTQLPTADSSDAEAQPLLVADSRQGVRLLVSRRSQPMPFVVRNVEADELHFIQQGQLRFHTDCGVLEAGPGDFVSIPKSITYRVVPLTTSTCSLIVESLAPFRVDAPVGLINAARDVHFARMEVAAVPVEGPVTLLLKAHDGITRFLMPHDPLTAVAHVFGAVPVWKVNLEQIQVVTFMPNGGGPPAQFITSQGNDVMLFNLSARLNTRSPIHLNADYDELVLYFRGPGAWGGVKEPGNLTWVPKGVVHQGPDENVPEGYMAWLMESRATFRLTREALEASTLIDTSTFAPHAG
ncbi:homogentisate 1,2-dioxygenase [Pseudomonas sp. PCH199]|uniref:homogentisate 1,2-dioxygenase n=1 Tax=unclassified Pseudomonas TaxID=196821 RepID=UPI000BC46E08|nr:MULTISPECIES: homogentisate 1,2-dioxygenase [unclassified Pseudomonas]MCW8279252.1 homogentisate 1,2-dioxygenase [Pseudomonas sp. PCH199]PAM78473.1 homogentisate 1,2-dioxygenase [Pseudomonas sp. ERMR1:02]